MREGMPIGSQIIGYILSLYTNHSLTYYAIALLFLLCAHLQLLYMSVAYLFDG